MDFLVRIQVGSCGLQVCLVILFAITFCYDVSSAATARLPPQAPQLASTPDNSSVASPPSNIKKRNTNLHNEFAFTRDNSATGNVSQSAQTSAIPISSLHSVSKSLLDLLVPAANFSSSKNLSRMESPNNKNGGKNTTASRATTSASRIGQALLNSNYLMVNDITVCDSEDCFETESIMHPRNIQSITSHSILGKRNFESADYWRHSALDALHRKLIQKPLETVAKNIIMFLGDGMSMPTVTAARILKGQQVDHMPFGEEGELHMDTFPYSGISKTFCSDAQVADSACSATAYLCGVKANSGTIGVTPDVTKNNCTAQNEPANRLSSILAWAQAAGKSTGVVTTARVTHASPAGNYANIANRNWENDHEIKRDGNDPNECDDIAEQLILREPGRNINVIMGGGRLEFLPKTKTDSENGRRGHRTDGKNLIELWKNSKFDSSSRYAYVEGKEQLLQVDTGNVDYLLGLFAPSHMEYFHEQEKHDDPSLAEMTIVALQILSRNPNGFFLFVEGGRIDHAHHNNQGLRAIWETVEMDRAIKKADEMTHDQDTLILVTSDHSHVFSLAGYPPRGNPIAGIAEMAQDNMPYTTLTYANGPAFKGFVNNRRYNITNDPLNDLKYKQIPNIPRKSETHGGDDVPMFAKGPFAHLFTGVQQQNYIPHALAYAACIGPGPKYCDFVHYS